MTKDEIKEYLELARQSGKKETSDLVDMIMKKLENKIEESITKNVNGKITAIDKKIDAYIISDDEWKKKYSPYLEGLENITSGGKIILTIAVSLATFLGLMFGLFKLLFGIKDL